MHGRAPSPTRRRLARPTIRPRRYRPPRTHHRPGSQHHRSWPARVGPRRPGVVGSCAAAGGGAQACGSQLPGILKALEELLADATAGDPASGMKWTHRSLRTLATGLKRRGIILARSTIARLMRQMRFSLRTCRKRKAGTRHKDRDRQFRYLTRLRRLYLTRELPVISVDTKKKELVGDFKNPGRCWRREDREVLDHDFPSWAVGRAIPYGIYDPAFDDGLVVVGTSHETPSFAVAAIRRWWLEVGRGRYCGKRRLLIEAAAGGANAATKWEWKVALQRLADEF